MIKNKLLHNLRLVTTPLTLAGRQRHVLWGFLLKETRGRFTGTIGGVLWALINPVAMIAVYMFVFSIVLRVQVTVEETGTSTFAIYFLSGLLPWILFSEGLSRSVGCLVGNASLITKVVFPVEVLPVSAVLSTFVINGLGMLVFWGFLVFAGYFSLTWLFLIFLVPAQILFTLGMACLLSAACVFIRDISELLGIVLILWFFATPIIYPISMVPAEMLPFISLNPMWTFVELYRDILLTHQVCWTSLARVCLLSIGSYGIGAWFFMRAKPTFGDVL